MKGMNRIKRGSGFGGVLIYLLSRDKKNESNPGLYLGGNVIKSTVKNMTDEFRLVSSLRPDIQKPVWHNSLRLPKGDFLSNEKWVKIADDYMQQLGFENTHQRVYILHDDNNGQHIHIVANRVGIDGQIYLGRNENLISTRLISELEQKHKLTATKNLEYIKDDDGNYSIKTKNTSKKRLTKNEVEQAIREASTEALQFGPVQPHVFEAVLNKHEPPRQKLQRIITATLEAKPKITAVEFADYLTTAGVSVHANIASTGRFNGFSFGIDNVQFKASQLGRAYSWPQLKKRVEYEQIRDSAELAKYASKHANTVNTASSSNASRAAGSAGSANTTVNTSVADARTNTASVGNLRPGNAHTAPEHRAAEQRNEQRAERGSGKHGKRNSAVEQGYSSERESYTTASKTATASATKDAQFSEKVRKEVEMVQQLSNNNSNSAINSGANNSWNARFKRASAAKRAAKSAVKVNNTDRVSARQIEPFAYLQAHGFDVVQIGKSWSVEVGGDEIYRLDYKNDAWLYCDRYGENGGDNIKLVQELEPGTNFTDAVYKLLGNPTVTQQAAPEKPAKQHATRVSEVLVTPLQTENDIKRADNYLINERKIDGQIVARAKNQGFIRATAGYVLFCGYDKLKQLRNITKRAVSAALNIQKQDAKGSNKSFAPVLQGNNNIWIVEGGIDALALHDLAHQQRKTAPTVIVSGGSGNRGFVDQPHIAELLKNADSITIAMDNDDDDPEKAERVKLQRQRQAQAITGATGKSVEYYTPSSAKDIADFNEQQKRQYKTERPQLKPEEHEQNNSGIKFRFKP